jgi:hypothetical protein
VHVVARTVPRALEQAVDDPSLAERPAQVAAATRDRERNAVADTNREFAVDRVVDLRHLALAQLRQVDQAIHPGLVPAHAQRPTKLASRRSMND